MNKSELRSRAKAVALHIIAVCDEIDPRKGRSFLVNQIIRNAASVGASIHEANYASSKADFTNKFHIALKECVDILRGKSYENRNTTRRNLVSRLK